MKYNTIVKILTSLPIILLTLYYISFLGICLLILKSIVDNNRKNSVGIILLVTGIMIAIPKLLNDVFDKINLPNISYLRWINEYKFYNSNLIRYSKLLIIIGILYIVIFYIIDKIKLKTKAVMKVAIMSQMKKEEKISKENDLIMKEKQERAKNTKVIVCSKCGSNNIITSKTGICKYCRQPLEIEE